MKIFGIEDPMTLLYFTPLLFGIVYILFSFFGERGE